MQLHKVKGQFEAASEFFNYENSRVPEAVLDSIPNKAFAEWPEDFEMQLYMLQNQVEAWLDLNG